MISATMQFGHRPLLLGLQIANVLLFIVSLFFNFISAWSGMGIFLSSQRILSDKYSLEITPAGWTFSIWGLIYTWQAVWIIYSLTLVFRSGPQGPLYLNPVLLSPAFFIIYILNLGCNIAWLLVFDREYLDVAFGFLIATVLTLYLCLGLSYTALERNKSVLSKSGRKIDDILIRAFVHNGLALYAAWTTIATFLNMAFVIAYRSDPAISVSIASTSALAGVAVALVVYVVTDLTVLDKYSRYTLTPYAVILWALGGSISLNYDITNTNTIFTLVLIGVGALSFMAKIICVIARRNSKPIFSPGSDGLEKKEHTDIRL